MQLDVTSLPLLLTPWSGLQMHTGTAERRLGCCHRGAASLARIPTRKSAGAAAAVRVRPGACRLARVPAKRGQSSTRRRCTGPGEAAASASEAASPGPIYVALADAGPIYIGPICMIIGPIYIYIGPIYIGPGDASASEAAQAQRAEFNYLSIYLCIYVSLSLYIYMQLHLVTCASVTRHGPCYAMRAHCCIQLWHTTEIFN
jgi:hypothetical protein